MVRPWVVPKKRKAFLVVVLAAIGFLLLPPAFFLGRSFIFLSNAERDYAEGVIASEVYYAFTQGEARHRSAPSYGHPYEWPYLDCPEGLEESVYEVSSEPIEGTDWTPARGEYALQSALITENDARYTRYYIDRLIKHYSPLELSLLNACLNASVLSNLCADPVRQVTWGSHEFDEFYSDYPEETDAIRGETMCRFRTLLEGEHGSSEDQQ